MKFVLSMYITGLDGHYPKFVVCFVSIAHIRFKGEKYLQTSSIDVPYSAELELGAGASEEARDLTPTSVRSW